MKLIVIEGIDGSGKSTQVKMLRKYFDDNQLKYQYLHFPRMNEGVFGKMVASFLRGEYGSINEVNPYLVALIYAADRNDAKEMIKRWLSEGYYVLLDRYVFSNIAFQCAKVNDETNANALKDWILNLEYEYNHLPVPDINIFLDVPFEFTVERLNNNRDGDDRDYLNGQKDIHEEDLEFQKRVCNWYRKLADDRKDVIRINCSDNHEKMLPPDVIFDKIIKNI
jgi:dTMP kinase